MIMVEFENGDQVRIDIPDESDPDFEWHGKHGTVVEVFTDDAAEVTGNESDSKLYRVEIEQEDTEIDVRQQDLRPPFVG